MKRRLVFALVILALIMPAIVMADRWKYPTKWTFKTPVDKVFSIAKNLPKKLPLKLVKAMPKEKKLLFKSDWGAMDIPKDVTLTCAKEGKDSTVDVDGASPSQAYQILREIGDQLKQPLPEPPRKHR